MNDNSMRIIAARWNWDDLEFAKANEAQMRYTIYPSTSLTLSSVKLRSSITSTNDLPFNYQELIDPWFNFSLVSFITKRDLEGNSIS